MSEQTAELELRKDPAKKEGVFVVDKNGKPIKHFNRYKDFERNARAADYFIEGYRHARQSQLKELLEEIQRGKLKQVISEDKYGKGYNSALDWAIKRIKSRIND